jgi:hypothetical protein
MRLWISYNFKREASNANARLAKGKDYSSVMSYGMEEGRAVQRCQKGQW